MRTSTEIEKRDRILNRLEVTRADLIDEARRIADEIDSAKGKVTAVEVMTEMREGVFRHDLMGAVFRAGAGWRRIGWETTGSHGRPVAIWTRNEAQ